ILGFHNAVTQNAAVAPDKSARVQTYAFIDFEASGAFPSFINDTSIAAHEVGEWMDDPFGNNPTPAWGHTGQVGGCQNNLEVGDTLTGTHPPVRCDPRLELDYCQTGHPSIPPPHGPLSRCR